MNTTKFYQIQQTMFDNCEDNSFFVARNSKKNNTSMEYASFTSIQKFLQYYNNIPQNEKSYYELIDPNSYMYEYYDLDTIIDQNNTNNITVFNWFVKTRESFIKSLYQNKKLLNPNWIITTASNQQKISLHIINKNIIFPNQNTIKNFMNTFKQYLLSSNTTNNIIDFAVYSKNRLMRITDSSKPNQNRPLTIWKDFHNNQQINIIDTFISYAQYDDNINNKIIYIEDFTSHQPIIQTSYTQNTSDDPQELYDNNTIESLLNLLSHQRVDDRDSWIQIGMALKNSGYDFEIWDNWSSYSNKYNHQDCQKQWNSFHTNTSSKLTIGTIKFLAKQDNPEGYKQLLSHFDNNNNKINLPFSNDITVNDKYISSNLYSSYLKGYDIICLKSNMNTGKTYSLPTLFNDFKRIIVVYSRISLNVAIHNKWKQYGFELYSNIKDHFINTNINNRIVVQIDSLHRVSGQCDLLILDEIETTHEHLCGSRLLEKTSECFHTLMSYTKNTPKIIMSDANLKDETINHLLQTRTQQNKTIKIQNTYQSFCNINTRFYFNEQFFLDSLQTFVKDNKKIVIPTNSKKKAKLMEKMILDIRPDYKILRIDLENKCNDVNSWINYDVVIYTPTITAGVSFDEIHFDITCAWFTRKSTSTEQSSQMLFRARNIKDNQMHILLPADTENEPSIPIEEDGLSKYVNDKIKLGNNFLKKDGLKIDSYNSKVQETKYFKLYISYLKKEALSFSYFHTYLKNILNNHGANITYHTKKLDENEQEEIKERIQEISLEIRQEEAKDINEALPISEQKYIELTNKNGEIDKNDLLSMKKYSLYKAFDKDINIKMNIDWVEKNIKHIHSVKRYKELTHMKFTNALQYIDQKKEQVYDNMIQNKKILDHSDEESISSDSDNDFEDNSKLMSKKLERRQRQKFIKHVGQTVVDSINYDKTYHKLEHCVEFLKAAGFNNLDHSNKIKPNFQAMIEYVRQNEKDIRTLWGCKRNSFEGDVEKDTTLKRGLMQYINSKLEGCLGVKIERYKNTGDCKDYIIKQQFVV